MSIKIEIIFKNNPKHLRQIYTGFSELAQRGIIDLTVSRKTPFDYDPSSRPVLNVILNEKVKIAYDTMDGFNYIPGTEQQNLDYLETQLENVDFYFKRSYKSGLPISNRHKLLPLGLYYQVTSSNNFAEKFYLYKNKPFKQRIKEYISHKPFIKTSLEKYGYTLNTKPKFSYDAFEYPPNLGLDPMIIFIPKVWSSETAKYDQSKKDRIEVSKMRIDLVIKLKQEFPSIFTGGIISDDPEIHRLYPQYVITDPNKTDRLFYTKLMHNATIGVSTRGLHRSIGNKFTEYIAASKCIVTEKLDFELPGDFEDGKNYLSFEDTSSCIDQIEKLLHDNNLRFEMMKRNYNYYHTYVRPDALVMNSINTVLKKIS
ncbi:MAG: glycosyltransferase family 1 protein [Desulfobacteraceae bacterium]|nr:MAG: glycosyltransferase family 1 protein [Desulfobacteraceae bacterium]